ncbi:MULTISPECIES: glycosyltransferase family 10 domain-containing protein [unclassified Roseofilum]|uniref:glycosyltransferase family 10 domain-containing protein n=1 Tax=unclassified Roseofilum TaxID=2620099 RepID=UPI001B0A46CB|nr:MULTISPECIES: glycosyltransferase family 10 [unclassified Roseofilum]MBP0008787.1 hypothetical protein [Roseofilum sp. Belize Diploria]MBP0032284.1 hypothetical protein [Roseofilum sp. Belize BBD 4]
MLNTPFTSKKGVDFFEGNQIQFVEAKKSDLIISGTCNKILDVALKFGSTKQYLIWTQEPRFSKNFSQEISSPFLPKINVMNVYTGIFSDNYYYLPCLSEEPRLVIKRTGFENKKIVSLMTYQAGKRWRLIHQGADIDLCNLRTEIALKGHNIGLLDIYGKGWPNGISVGQSRGKFWRSRKIEILKKYSFNLCFENTNWPYYCTEKIWDSIQGGCLPIYYGDGNKIYEDFPENSFLDYFKFRNPDLLFDYIQDIREAEFEERMLLCVDALRNALNRKQEEQPYQKVLDRTLLRIRTILGWQA